MNAIGIISTTFQTEELMSHLIIFYLKDPLVETKIQKIKKDDIVRAAGKFTIEEKNLKDHEISVTNLSVIKINPDHLLPLDIIVTLNGTVMENPPISETIVKFKINSLVYIKKKKMDINFNAYHKTTEKHLKPISKKLNHGHTIFLSGNLELVNGLKMIQLTSLSFLQKLLNKLWIIVVQPMKPRKEKKRNKYFKIKKYQNSKISTISSIIYKRRFHFTDDYISNEFDIQNLSDEGSDEGDYDEVITPLINQWNYKINNDLLFLILEENKNYTINWSDIIPSVQDILQLQLKLRITL
ncbi:8100_t:CDS:2 [Entrophospora sp. SA101]|nr:8100_t:CDS:2 [Entrophospora sp. SA101]